MFRVAVSDSIMIAHSFPDPFFGPAQRLHGATYEITAEVRTPNLNRHHVVMDIGALKKCLAETLAPLAYRNLDEVPAFAKTFSTTERVAEHVANELAHLLARLPKGEGIEAPSSLEVRVYEARDAYASYERAIERGA